MHTYIRQNYFPFTVVSICVNRIPIRKISSKIFPHCKHQSKIYEITKKWEMARLIRGNMILINWYSLLQGAQNCNENEIQVFGVLFQIKKLASKNCIPDNIYLKHFPVLITVLFTDSDSPCLSFCFLILTHILHCFVRTHLI